jgi:hypothetical protein
MHKLKHWQLYTLVIILTILLATLLTFETSSVEIYARGGKLLAMDNEVDIGDMKLNDEELYKITWYTVFNKVIYQKIELR